MGDRAVDVIIRLRSVSRDCQVSKRSSFLDFKVSEIDTSQVFLPAYVPLRLLPNDSIRPGAVEQIRFIDAAHTIERIRGVERQVSRHTAVAICFQKSASTYAASTCEHKHVMMWMLLATRLI